MDDIEAIKQLKARYFRSIDTKDWDGLRGVLTPDVHVDVGADGGGTFDGVDVFLDMLVPTLTDVVTVHHGHMPEIESPRPRRPPASGRWRTCCSSARGRPRRGARLRAATTRTTRGRRCLADRARPG